jgi:tetratricopeptide (TPR) repeat protein
MNNPIRISERINNLPSMQELASALESARQQHGEGSQETAEALRLMAKNAVKLGPDYYEEASSLFQSLVALQLYAFGESAELAETYHSLSGLNKSQNRYADAAQYLQLALDMYDRLSVVGKSLPPNITPGVMQNWRKILIGYYRSAKQPDSAQQLENTYFPKA